MVNKDFHMHCRFSTDSQAEPEAMCEAAIARGLREICFTDHQDVYFETVLKNLEQFDCFHTLGHIDYMRRYVPQDLTPYRFEDHAEQIDRILKAAIGKGIAIEVNTGGLYKGAGQTNPEERIIRRYLALGGSKLSYGSDAHRPEFVGFGFETLPDYDALSLHGTGSGAAARTVD